MIFQIIGSVRFKYHKSNIWSAQIQSSLRNRNLFPLKKIKGHLFFQNSVFLVEKFSHYIVFWTGSLCDFGNNNFIYYLFFFLVAAENFQALPFPKRQKYFENFRKLQGVIHKTFGTVRQNCGSPTTRWAIWDKFVMPSIFLHYNNESTDLSIVCHVFRLHLSSLFVFVLKFSA